MFELPYEIQQLVVLGALFYAGWWARGYFHIRDIESIIDRMVEDGVIHLDEEGVKSDQGDGSYLSIKIEKHGDIAYIYEEDTNNFMFQVTHKDEFAKMVHDWAGRNNLSPSNLNIVLDEASSKILENLS